MFPFSEIPSVLNHHSFLPNFSGKSVEHSFTFLNLANNTFEIIFLVLFNILRTKILEILFLKSSKVFALTSDSSVSTA